MEDERRVGFSGIKENLAANSVASQPAIAGTKGRARQAASVETL